MNVLEKLNLALLMSHRAYNGHPPSSYRKALCRLLTISMNPHDRSLNGLDAKLDAAIQAMHNPNANDGLAAFESLQDFVNSVATRNGEQLPQFEAIT